MSLLHRAGHQLSGTLMPRDGFTNSIRKENCSVKRIEKRVAHGAVPSTDNGRGSHIKSNSSGEIIAEDSSSVKEQLWNKTLPTWSNTFRRCYLDQSEATVLLRGAKVLMPKMPATNDSGFIYSLTVPKFSVK